MTTAFHRFAYPVHYKWHPGDTLRYHCTYDSSDTSDWTHFGINANDEMCIIYIGYVDKIDGCNLIFNEPVHEVDTLLTPTYCASFSWLTWSEVKNDSETLIFENSERLRSSNRNLKVEDDIPELCKLLVENEADLISNELILRFDIPILTMYPTLIIGANIWLLLKLTEYAMSRVNPGCYAKFADSLEHKRKVVIYFISIWFYSVILVTLLWVWWWNATEALSGDECQFIYNEFNEDHSVDIPLAVATAGNLSIIFLVIELMYRVQVCST